MTVDGTTTQFGYSDAYPDRLTSYNGKPITYNSMGCVSNYDGKNYTWSKGKLRLFSMGSRLSFDSPYQSYSYTYDAKGQRVVKSYSYSPGAQTLVDYVTDKNCVYTYDNNGRLIRERRSENYKLEYSITREFTYLYDESGMIGFTYSYEGATPQAYYYQRNLLGDVIAIYNANGVKQAGYAYDAWGNCTITNSTNSDIANANAIRYRGYYFDVETGWYFLNARYYNPEWRRFISPDDTSYLDPENVNGLNLYCYCGNDPVNFVDPSGHLALSTVILIIAGIAVVNTISNAIIGDLMDIPIVYDFSLSLGLGAGIAGKIGISLVLDFKNNSFGFYPHYGFYFGAKANVVSGSYGTGFISNYQNEGDYQGPFFDFGGGFYVGTDHCYDPRYPYNDTVRATSTTYGNGKGVYFGYDYYGYWGSIPFWTE